MSDVAECADCGRAYEVRPGRGARSAYCADCQARRRRRGTEVRNLRQAAAQFAEWVGAFGDMVLEAKGHVTALQDGRCHECGRSRRLYIARDGDLLRGFCLEDFEKRGRSSHAVEAQS